MNDIILDPLDPDQYEVATSFERPVVVLAGAGSGKTRAITHRVAQAVRDGRYDPRATLAVTFTTRAAGEMRARLAQLGVGTTQARTIHSAALRQCQYFWPQVYNTDFPAVADSTFGFVARAASSVLDSAETALVRDLETEIGWGKSNNVPPERYAELAGERTVSGASPAQVGAVFASYEKLKAAAGQVDFNDILLCAAHLIHDHPEVGGAVTETYRHFVVDEYQDVSALQHRLIELWVAGRDDLCVVGDPRQSIHGFAGADAGLLLELARRPDVDVVNLRRNYRSTPQICAVANGVLRIPRGQGLRAVGDTGPEPEWAPSNSEASEAAEVAGWLAALRQGGTRWSEMAVLYRINAQSAQLEAALTQRSIPYTVRGTERFYERAEVRQAMALLSKAAATQPEAPAMEMVDQCWQTLGWTPEPPGSSGRQRERWESLGALRGMISAEDPADARSLVDWLAQRAAWQASPVSEAVTLASMHSSKGLEWDAVAIIGAREGLVPFSLAQEEPALSEERRLLHVAVTRARSHLRISWSEGSAGRGNPSRFLTGLVPAAASPRESVTRRKRSGGVSCTVCGKPVRTAAERKLKRHEDCEATYDEALLEALKRWRKEEADRASVPAFVVFTDATLMAISEAKPTNESELIALPGIGRTKVSRYAEACLGIIRQHLA